MKIKKILVYLILLFISSNVIGQSSEIPISVGYFAPYGLNIGIKASTAFEINNWEDNAKLSTLSISPQVGYWSAFAYGNDVNNSLVLDAQLEYRRYNANQTFYGLASAGLGYHLTLENSTIGVDIGTGQLNPSTTTSHHFVPSINLGFGKDFSDKLGFYFKAFTGKRFSSSVGNDFLLGGELGLTFYIIKG